MPNITEIDSPKLTGWIRTWAKQMNVFLCLMEFPGLSMGMGFLWESHGKRPMGRDGTAHVCISH